MPASPASRLACGLGAVALIATGCVQTTAGTAMPADTAGPNSPTKSGQSGAGIERILLGADAINAIMGSKDIELMDSANDMADHSADISDPKCVGALYNAEDSVYAGTGWKDVADQVLTEPEDDSAHWVEQTVVEFPSATAAKAFVDSSFTQWTYCIGKSVMVNDGEYEYHWQFEGISSVDGTISQTTRQSDSDGWSCQHALGAVDSFVLEASACGISLQEEAVDIVHALAANAR
ncbi:sensor domain-containing protein [Mycolicibacterium komossense]|uniref:Sensor domain-containing protein n=1 Tax=Mycolicibacterium komossense TaxID=1779 RepID=A0ABT3C7U6_9MYCO|nr:sensor domain-containing protein [Mycolicibacterium komossense]MCV7225515.1 sensor domain-containing protein [Mycolicibacterium komossense]